MLERELETYEANLPQLLGQDRGKFVLIKDSDVIDTFTSIDDALKRGYEAFEDAPFLVKQIVEVEIPQNLHTPSTTVPVKAATYNVSLTLPNGVLIPSVIAIEAPLGGQHIQCLIGRDVLQHGVLTYIGYINQFTLSF